MISEHIKHAAMQGLGKTVQVIALLAHLVESRGISGPFLIVSPSSVLPNWEAELRAWAPQLSVLLYQGSVQERKTLLAAHVSPSQFQPLRLYGCT